jgi:hypothetical protein
MCLCQCQSVELGAYHLSELMQHRLGMLVPILTASFPTLFVVQNDWSSALDLAEINEMTDS